MTATAADLVLRRDRMLALIRERDFVRVGELSERFGISEVTVRSDLDALAASGDVQRIRGGAIPREHAFEVSETSFAAEKLAIGRAAADLVRDGETLLMEARSKLAATSLPLVFPLELRNVTVYQKGLKTAL